MSEFDETNPFVPRKFSGAEVNASVDIATFATKLWECYLQTLPASRERSVAITKLEESIMWSNKAIRKTGVLEASEE